MMPRFGTVCRLVPMLVLAGLLLCMTLTTPAVAVEPRHCIPAKGLVAYVEYEGLDAHAEAWQKTAAHDLLYKTPTGPMLVKLFQQLADRPIQEEFGGVFDASRALETLDLIARKGFAFGVYCDPKGNAGGVLVVKNFADTPLAQLTLLFNPGVTTRIIRGREIHTDRNPGDDESLPNPLHIDEPPGAEVEVPSSEVQIDWMEGDDLIVVLGHAANGLYSELIMERQVGCRDSVDIILDTIEGKEPDITTHPGFQSASAEGKDLKGFEPNGMFFAEIRPDLQGPAFLMMGTAELAFAPADLLFEYFVSPKKGKSTSVTASSKEKAKENVVPTPLQPIEDDIPYLEVSPGQAPVAANAGPKPGDGPPAILPVDETVARASLASASKRDVSKPEQKKPTAQKSKGHGGPDFDEEMLEAARKLGFEGARRIIARWGFQDRALLSTVRIEAPTPRKGVFTLFDQPDFATDRLPVIPTDARSFVLASLSPEAVYQKVVESTRSLDPEAAKHFYGLELMIWYELGIRFQEDLLRPLGPNWAVVDIPAKDHGTDMVLVASVDDPDAFDKVVSKLSKAFDEQVRPDLEAYMRDRVKKAGYPFEIGTYGLTKLPAPDRGYRISFPPIRLELEEGDDDDFRFDPCKEATMSLYLVIGKSSVALCPELEPARRVLAEQTGPWKPDGSLTSALDGLPANLTYLSITDPARCSVPETIAAIPGLTRMILTGTAAFPEKLEFLPEPIVTYLEFFGLIPHPEMPIVQLAPAETAKPEDIRTLVFSSVLATSVDERGYRIIHRQPFPLAGLFSEIAVHQKWSLKWNGLRLPELRFKLNADSPRFSRVQ